MKIVKKICVYLLVGMITFSSVTLSYQKANSCEAVSIGVGIVTATLLLGLGLYGAYYVSQPENQDNVKQALSDYANTTAEGAQMQYEMNKKLFNDFCDYAISHAGSNAAVRTADGSTYTVEDMKKESFPSFEKWDEEMKKQSKKPNKGFGNIWDALSFGVELLDLLCRFFDNSGGSSGSGGFGLPQLYFTGDDGYKNLETGQVNISLYGLAMACEPVSYSPLKNQFYHETFTCLFSRNYGASVKNFRAYALLENSKVKFYQYAEEGNSSKQLYSTQVKCSVYSGTGTSVLYPSYSFSRTVWEKGEYKTYDGSSSYMCVYSSYPCDSTYDHPFFISTNVPLFATREEGLNYVNTGDASTALNLPPVVTVAPTSAPSERPVTPVSIYCRSFSGKNVTVNDITNVNYYIANNWVTTGDKVENLTTVINNYYENDFDEPLGGKDEEESTPTPRPTLTPTENETGRDTNTYNFFIEIENILNPIKVTVENIYNFFLIDTDEISYQLNMTNVLPTDKFNNFVTTFGSLKNTFSDNTQDVIDGEASASVTGSTQRGIVYPKIKVQAPEILKNYVPYKVKAVEDGKIYIVLCDCKKYAVQFSAIRTLLKALIWFGFIFYLLRELKVTISLNG